MKLKVAVLFGGNSTEHEISIISAIQAIGYINEDKYEVIPVYITKNSEYYVGEDVGKIEEYTHIPELIKKSTKVIWVKDGDRVSLVRYPMKKFGNNVITTVDVAFPSVHGTNVEDGTLQGFLKRGLPVWKKCLEPGGVIALSFNTFTLPSSDVRSALESAGLTLPENDLFYSLKHEVEQAVTRDVIFAFNTQEESVK